MTSIPILPILGLLAGLGLQLRAQDPRILAIVAGAGEDPSILHLVGEGFGSDPAQLRLGLDPAARIPFVLVNPSHIICTRPPATQPPATWLTLEAAGLACRYPLDLPPLRVGDDPLELQCPGGGHALAERFNAAVRAAFAPPPDAGPPSYGPEGVPEDPEAASPAAQANPDHSMVLHRDPDGPNIRVDNGRPIPLTATETRLLATLADRPGKAATTRELAIALYGRADSAKLKAAVGMAFTVRQKLEAVPSAPRLLVTLHPSAGAKGGGFQLQLRDLSPGALNLPAATHLPPPATLSFGPPGSGMVLFNGRQVQLARSSFRILQILYDRPGKAATFDWLTGQLGLEHVRANRNAVQKAVGKIRTEIELDPGNPGYLLSDANVDGQGHFGYRLNIR